MARSNEFPRVLWLLTTTWLAGCGRLGFDAHGDDPIIPLADAATFDADISGPGIDAEIIDARAPAALTVVSTPTGMTTTCAGAAVNGELLLKNTGGTDLVISKLTVSGDPFTAVAPAMTIGPGETITVDVTPPAATLGTDIGGRRKAGQLKIESNTSVMTVSLDALIIGANLVITAPTPPLLVLNGTSGNCPAPGGVTISNKGNRAFTVSLQPSTVLAISGFSGGQVGAGTSVTTDVSVLTGGACSGVGAVQYTITGTPNNCGASSITVLPAQFTISGASASCICP